MRAGTFLVLVLLLFGAPAEGRTIYFTRSLDSLLTIGDVPNPGVPQRLTEALSADTSFTPRETLAEMAEWAAKLPLPQMEVAWEAFTSDVEPGGKTFAALPTISSRVLEKIFESKDKRAKMGDFARSVFAITRPRLAKAAKAPVRLEIPSLGTRAQRFLRAMEFVASGLLYDDGHLYLEWAVVRAREDANQLNDRVASEMSRQKESKWQHALGEFYRREDYKQMRQGLTELATELAAAKARGQWQD